MSGAGKRRGRRSGAAGRGSAHRHRRARRILTVHQLRKRHVKRLAERLDDAVIRHTPSVLALGDGLVRYAEPFCELLLREILRPPLPRDIAADVVYQDSDEDAETQTYSKTDAAAAGWNRLRGIAWNGVLFLPLPKRAPFPPFGSSFFLKHRGGMEIVRPGLRKSKIRPAERGTPAAKPPLPFSDFGVYW